MATPIRPAPWRSPSRHAVQVLGLAALGLMAASSAPAAAVPSEEELTALETKVTEFHPADVTRLATLNYHVQFALAFQGAQAQTAAASDSTPPDGLAKSANVLEGARAVNAVAVGLPNAIHNPLDTKLMSVSIALSVIDLFRKKPVSDAQLQLRSWKAVQDHSFFLVHIMPGHEEGNVDADMARVFAQGQAFLTSSALACANAAERQPAASPGALGQFVPAGRHLRLLLCDGTDASQALPNDALRREAVDLLVQPMPKAKGRGRHSEATVYDGGIYGLIAMPHLDQRDHIRHLVDPDASQSPERYGRLLYERLKDRIPEGWVAVFSEQGATGIANISVGNCKHDITLQMPPLPGAHAEAPSPSPSSSDRGQ